MHKNAGWTYNKIIHPQYVILFPFQMSLSSISPLELLHSKLRNVREDAYSKNLGKSSRKKQEQIENTLMIHQVVWSNAAVRSLDLPEL